MGLKSFRHTVKHFMTRVSMNSTAYIGDSALAAKHRGSKKSFESSLFILCEDWDDGRVQIMRECVEVWKPSMPHILLKTGEDTACPSTSYRVQSGHFLGNAKGQG